MAAQTMWTDVEVKIQAARTSDGKKLIVAKEGSDLHIVCETSVNAVSVQWKTNEFTQLTEESDPRVVMTSRIESVQGRPQMLHTLIIHDTSTMDTATYACQSGTAADEVVVRIVRAASKQLATTSVDIRNNGWHGGVVVRASDLRSRDREFGSRPVHRRVA